MLLTPEETRENKIGRAVADTAQKAIEEAHAAGLYTTHGDKKGIYRLYPDGRKEYTELY